MQALQTVLLNTPKHEVEQFVIRAAEQVQVHKDLIEGFMPEPGSGSVEYNLHMGQQEEFREALQVFNASINALRRWDYVNYNQWQGGLANNSELFVPVQRALSRVEDARKWVQANKLPSRIELEEVSNA